MEPERMGERSIDRFAAAPTTFRQARRSVERTRFALLLLATSVLFLFVTIAAPASAQRDERAARSELVIAYRAKAAGDLTGAQRAFARALELGAEPQRVHLELGYVELAQGHRGAARSHFEQAAHGPDAALAENARAQLVYLPAHLWGDVYFETYAWHRLSEPVSTNLVPMLRLRGMWRPILDVDFSFYVYGQITRDVASRNRTPTSLPLIYADNHALVGGGGFLRLFEGRVGIWAQAGPAFNLLEDGRERISFDGRIGIAGAIESDDCRMRGYDGVRTLVGPCVEGYGEIVYVSRFNHDVVGTLRGRAGYGLLLTGPVLWQPLIEVRALGGKNGDYYNNRAEVGLGHRWRLLEPFVLDLITTVHGGVYYGVRNVDPVPDPPLFLELRLILATYVEVVP
jgi:hypothetical protein